MKIQIRKPGSYEIVFYNKDKQRVKELVCTEGLFLARVEASAALHKDPEIHSYTIAKIIDNSLFNTWSTK